MEREKLNEILRLHKLWLNDEDGGRCADLSSADLSSADLRSADLSSADLRSADLRSASLVDANLSSADLRSADLRSASLVDANLRDADLRGADLRDTDLRWADLRGAYLDYSCLPLWCGGLGMHIDDKIAVQLLYHVLSNVQYSKNVSPELKRQLLTPDNCEAANRFHRGDECGEIEPVSE